MKEQHLSSAGYRFFTSSKIARHEHYLPREPGARGAGHLISFALTKYKHSFCASGRFHGM